MELRLRFTEFMSRADIKVYKIESIEQTKQALTNNRSSIRKNFAQEIAKSSNDILSKWYVWNNHHKTFHIELLYHTRFSCNSDTCSRLFSVLCWDGCCCFPRFFFVRLRLFIYFYSCCNGLCVRCTFAIHSLVNEKFQLTLTHREFLHFQWVG